ncbi:MAG TPA: glycosyl hydrolase, partial [Verrucomicrobiota bacterium]|nr:glycosyl hydrolase [Verrucomicrobiota bacterium]
MKQLSCAATEQSSCGSSRSGGSGGPGSWIRRYRLTTVWLVQIMLVMGGPWTELQGAEPANPKANKKTRAVLDYFYSLEKRSEKRILSGQFADFGAGARLQLLEEVRQKTGQWPGFIGVDYADFRRGSLTYDAPNEAVIAYWRQGGLVTISAHL